MPDEKRVENLMRQRMHCRHFNGVQHDRCKAGVSYRESWPPPWPNGSLPCLGRSTATCEMQDFPTADEARAMALEAIKQTDEMLAPVIAAHADALAKGFKKGNGGSSDCECPRCGKRLRYTIAALNGHMWAKCETEGCAAWIE